MTRVFVYGTLKKGQPNYHRLFDPANGKAEFLASARTVEKHPLVIAGKYNIPFLLNVPGEGWRVLGEIYSVDDRMLAFLDAFESVPAMYQRTPMKLEVDEWAGGGPGEGEEEGEKGEEEGEEGSSPSAGTVVEAFVYSTTTFEPAWPSLPNYESYDTHGSHGLKYVSREWRD